MLTTSLVATDRFVVLERLELDEVLEEQEFGASGRVNPETAAGVGGTIGAQVLVTGDITEFHYERSSAGGSVSVLGGVDMEVDRVNAMVALDLRLIDAVTGEVLSAVRDEGTASATGAGLDVDVAGQSFGTAGSLSTPLGQASREEDFAITNFGDLRYTGWGGGVPITFEGQVVGAIGISGLPEADDVALARGAAANWQGSP